MQHNNDMRVWRLIPFARGTQKCKHSNSNLHTTIIGSGYLVEQKLHFVNSLHGHTHTHIVEFILLLVVVQLFSPMSMILRHICIDVEIPHLLSYNSDLFWNHKW